MSASEPDAHFLDDAPGQRLAMTSRPLHTLAGDRCQCEPAEQHQIPASVSVEAPGSFEKEPVLAQLVRELTLEHRRVLNAFLTVMDVDADASGRWEELINGASVAAEHLGHVAPQLTAVQLASESMPRSEWASKLAHDVDENGETTSRNSSEHRMQKWTTPALKTPCASHGRSLRRWSTREVLHMEVCKQVSVKESYKRRPVKSRPGRVCIKGIVEHPSFEMFFALLIFANTFLIALETDLSAHSLNTSTDPALEVTQEVFTWLFLFEWVLRVTAAGCRAFFLPGPDFHWNWLDTFIILSSLPSMKAWELVSFEGVHDSWTPTGLRSTRVVRLTRLVRVMRVSKLLHIISALRYLVYSIFSTLKSLLWAMALLVLIFYLFGAVLTTAATEFRIESAEGDLVEEATYYWGGMWISMYTLFMSISGGVSWIEPLQPLWAMGDRYVALFTVYVAFVYFAVLNVVTGVFCEKAIQSAAEDHLNMMATLQRSKTELKTKLENLFQSFDTDGSGLITLDEFLSKMKDDHVLAYLESMGVDVMDAPTLFRFLDNDGGGSVDITELVCGCIRMKGNAKSMDMLSVMLDIRKIKEQVKRIASSVDELFYKGDAAEALDENGKPYRSHSSVTD